MPDFLLFVIALCASPSPTCSLYQAPAVAAITAPAPGLPPIASSGAVPGNGAAPLPFSNLRRIN